MPPCVAGLTFKLQVPPIRKKGTNTYAYLIISSVAFLDAIKDNLSYPRKVDIDAVSYLSHESHLQKLNALQPLRGQKSYLQIQNHLEPPPTPNDSSAVEKYCLCVPLIMVGSSWGSGVIISPLPNCCILLFLLTRTVTLISFITKTYLRVDIY